MTVWSYNVPDGTYVFKFMCIYDVLVYSPEPQRPIAWDWGRCEFLWGEGGQFSGGQRCVRNPFLGAWFMLAVFKELSFKAKLDISLFFRSFI